MDNISRIKMWLQRAMEIEQHGVEFYGKVAANASDWRLADFFLNMADQERLHLKLARDIYNSVGEDGDINWPESNELGAARRNLNRIFLDMIPNMPNGEEELLMVLETAMHCETESAKFYERAVEAALSEAEEMLLRTLATEEREHQRMLLTIYNYYADLDQRNLMRDSFLTTNK